MADMVFRAIDMEERSDGQNSNYEVGFVGVEKNKGSYATEPRVMALSERHLIFRVSSNNLG